MNMVDIIEKKKNEEILNDKEIAYFIENYTNEKVPDYQVSALLMAIVLNGMNIEETTSLTNHMLHSGDLIDLSSIDGIKVDKHSTGGVGDKVSLILAPLLASAGVSVAKMSGRGLGHTGGTLDKLAAIPNFKVDLDVTSFIKQVNDIKVSIIGQSANLVPADKKLYALRDVTGTVQSIPLIASSIMSKKLACGADAILLDVKVGEGAFMKTLTDAQQLAQVMVDIGKKLNRDVKAVITDMNQPLGHAIGNGLEVVEAIATLKGEGPEDLQEICLSLGAIMLVQANKVNNTIEAYEMLKEKIKDGSALEKFKELVRAQGGDVSYIENPAKFKKAKYKIDIIADKKGYLNKINALAIGHLALELGAGRHDKDDEIDYEAGLYIYKQLGASIDKGAVIASLYTNKDREEVFKEMFNEAITIEKTKQKLENTIKDIIK